MSTSTKIGRGLAKGLGIKLNYRTSDPVTRGESAYSIDTADSYVEDEPSSIEWLQSLVPSGRDIVNYLYSLVPFVHWITRYNVQWLIGDLVAGITVGGVVVPQSMAYAKLAELPVQFGLYSSFMGVLIYWFFATSKDITIGPVAVLSTLTGNVVLGVIEQHPEYEGSEHVIASALAVIAGAIVCFLGLARLGRIVDFISLASISAFMTGSALNIAVGQVPSLMGIAGKFNTRAPTYEVVINILKNLGNSTLDAAIGLTALAFLYLYRIACTVAAKKKPNRARLFFFLSTLRTVLVLLIYILISYLINRNHRDKPRIKILGRVPRGFQNAAVPTLNIQLISAFASDLPSVVIVMLIEHIAISKSFGRVNHYIINPSQEMVAMGVTNLLGPFLGAYPATGSFSRTAIKSKAGVRTPFAGVITALVVLLAIYALPAMFFYIPNAGLSAVIIHAVGDLITPPNTVFQFWRVAPLDVPIFFAGVIVTVFSTIENGIYVTICLSAGVLLYRLLYAQGDFLGRVKVHSAFGGQQSVEHLKSDSSPAPGLTVKHSTRPDHTDAQYDTERSTRNLFLPLSHHDGTNPVVSVQHPHPGIFLYRFREGFNFPNANPYFDQITDTVFKECRRTNPRAFPRLGDRPWNDPGPRRGQVEADDSHLPTLKAIILDFSSVNQVDITSVQHLIDVRNQLDRYTAPEKVQWHFAAIQSKWTKRALAAAGFGFPTPDDPSFEFHRWKPIFSVAEIGGDASAAAAAEVYENQKLRKHTVPDAERGDVIESGSSSGSDGQRAEHFSKQLGRSGAYGTVKVAPVHGITRPLFHTDLTTAFQSAIAIAESRTAYVKKESD